MSPSTFHFLRIDIFCDRGSTPIPPPLLHGAELNNWLRFCYIISAQTGSQKVFIAVTSPGISGRIWDLRLASQQARIGIFVWHLKTGFGIFAWHLKQDLAHGLVMQHLVCSPISGLHVLLLIIIIILIIIIYFFWSAQSVLCQRDIWKNKETFIFFL